MEEIFRYFKEHYRQDPWDKPQLRAIDLKQLEKVDSEALEEDFCPKEVWMALRECNGNKAPGLDGFNLNFIKRNWDSIKEDFLNFLKDFHSDQSVVSHLNRTFFALIPKVGNRTKLSDFRPISFVGSLYKLLAKILANRLKKVMNVLIGDTQMAFVKGRQIIDNFVIANEIIHSWKNDREGGAIVKLDFENAYDCIDHEFLDIVMDKMGFGSRWRRWISSCISTPTLSVLVNGCPTEQFVLQKGLRQGDPLSHLLFNIAIEALNQLLVKATSQNLLEGARFGLNGEHITHLQFTDDTIVFLKPKIEYLINLKRILRCFEMISGLRINFQKSYIARVVKLGMMENEWADSLRCKVTNLPICYLRLPLGANPNKKSFWDPVVQKIEKRLAPWKMRCLSKGGRLVLIQSVLASMPTCFMSIFKMPVGVAKKLEKLQREFFWGDGVLKRKIYSVDWKTMCKRKENGGLGIGHLMDKNTGLLAKWIWRFGSEVNSLWKRVLCAKYGMNINDLSWKLKA
ncbi:hypothetical protein Dsin_020993 [Dipteronia sinensis]|uniref:Reverse transcriptase domain-containing protein n=1 Tax=Dipteronia sinensis TaxID=43782 RepID=A0AAE0AAT2_9ROSI|nr:hypothetical protein Dsin_020993 [Dipteronia sinensis]